MSKKISVLGKWNYIIGKMYFVLMLMIALLIILVNVFRVLGLVNFKSGSMNDTYFASIIFLCLILIHEYNQLKEKHKLIIMGMMCGSILSLYEEKIVFLLPAFVVNTIYFRMINGSSSKSIFSFVAKLIFYGMLSFEMYSIFTIWNDYLYKYRNENSLLFNYIDILFLLSLVLIFLFDEGSKKKSLVKRKNFKSEQMIKLQMVKLCIWCFLIICVVLITITTSYASGMNGAEKLQFYFGKSINGGYLLCENTNGNDIYYVKKQLPVLGGIFECCEAYEMVALGKSFSYQIVLLYLLKCIYQLMFGACGVIVMSTIVIGIVINKIFYFVKFSAKRRRE